MSRHKKHDRPTRLNINIPASVHRQVEASLKDPLYGKPAFGAWSTLVTSLLTAWLDRKVPIHMQPIQVDLSRFKGEKDEGPNESLPE